MKFSYRTIQSDDLQLFYFWANDPEVRNNSFYTDKISFEEHSKWFEQKIQDKNTLFFIVEIQGEAAGMVRFDIAEKSSTINIIIDKKFRGRNLASTFLQDCCKLYFKNHTKPILAYIKSSNLASIQSFTKAKFTFLKDETIKNTKSKIFIKENDH